MKFISFVRGNTISCIRRPAHSFGGSEFAGPGRIDSSPSSDHFGGVVLQRAADCHSCPRGQRREKCVAVSGSESAGDRLHLVQLPPRPTEPRFACADAWRVCRTARQTGGRRRRLDCSWGGYQSFSSPRDRLSNLPAVLDRSSKSCCEPCIFTSHFTGAIPRS